MPIPTAQGPHWCQICGHLNAINFVKNLARCARCDIVMVKRKPYPR
jgi:hypothetical protein